MKNSIRLLGLPLLAFLLFVALPAFAYNMADAGTHSPRPELPTRTPTAVSPTIAPEPEQQTKTAVSSIILIADSDMSELQTAVQWQDSKEKWHIVEGWQAPFNTYNQVTWAVARNDYGKGPFRWIILDGDTMVDNSSDFYLPLSAHETKITHIGNP